MRVAEKACPLDPGGIRSAAGTEEDTMTTTWQKRMKADLETAGYAPGTRDHYFRAACRLVAHCARAPEQIEREEVRGYFDVARKKDKRSPSWLKVEMAGVRFLFGVTP